MMKNRIESALKNILDNKTLRAQWSYAWKQGGAEKIIQACLAQELNDESNPNVFIEFKKADIAIFDDGTEMPPTHIIEIGTNYLGQIDAKNKPLKDIFKRTSNEVTGETYAFENVYSLMFIAEKIVGNEVIFPSEGKKYINKKVSEPLTALEEIKDYWESYVKSPDPKKRANLGNKNKTVIDFNQSRDIHIDEILSNKKIANEMDDHKLHCYLIQIK